MVAIIRTAEGVIKTFCEWGDDFVLQPGESREEIEMGFASYSARLRLSIGGRSGESIVLPAGTTSVEVRVACPGQGCIAVEVNNEERLVTLENGLGSFIQELEAGGTYVIRPRDRSLYCAAGEALLAVLVEHETG